MRKTIALVSIAMLLGAGVALAGQEAPVCGDVNDSNTITTTDALLVLRKSVSQPVTLDCSGYDDRFSSCQSSLTACQNVPVCGDGIVEDGEDCEAGILDKGCANQGFAGGVLACSAGCTFDTSGCYVSRYDASGPTIIDHETGLEWEKKDSNDDEPDDANPHDADNS